MNYQPHTHDRTGRIDIIRIDGIEPEAAKPDDNAAEDSFRVNQPSHPRPACASSVRFIPNTHRNGMKRNQPDVRLLVYLSASHNPLRLSLNQARNRVGREPFKGLMMASIAGMLTRVRLFR